MNELMLALADFHFLRPEWLWALLPSIVLGGLLSYFHKQQTGWQSVLPGHLYQHLISHAGHKKLRRPLWLLTLGWIIATLALAGPTWQRLPQPVYQLHSGKVVLLDMSLSMRATDIKPNRLTRAKYKAIDLVKQIGEGETGLVAYAGDAFTISPLSSDGQNLTTLIPSLSPEIMPIAGSEPFLGLQAAIDLLRNANYQQGEIFWITDGVENRQMKEISELLNASPYRLSVLAVGTEEGAPIQLQDGELLKNAQGAIVLPKLNEANLKTLARQGGGRYAPLQTDNRDIDYLTEQTLLSDEQQQDDEQQAEDNFGDKWQEMGPYLLLILLPFVAYCFRRGLINLLLLGILLPLASPQADAGWWQDMWQTRDQQGLQAFNQQQYDVAADTFADPMWQGAALYKNQQFEEALKAFSQVNDAQGLYNQANTLAQLGKLQEALDKYDQSLALAADNPDAIANRELVEKLLQQQEQQQQSQQNQQNDQQQDSQQQDQQQQDGQQQDQQQDGQQQDEQQPSEQQNQQDQQQDGQPEQQQDQQQSEGQQQDEQQAQQQEQAASAEEQSAQQQQQAEAQQAQAAELTDEQKEQMQRMQNLLNRVPDDPAFLLKRKMQIEAQQRKRERVPSNIQRNW